MLYILFIFSVMRAIGYYTILWHILRKRKVNKKTLLQLKKKKIAPIKYEFKSDF